MLASRFKQALGKNIFETKLYFIPGMFILNNTLASSEIVHFMKSKTQRRLGHDAQGEYW